MWSGLVMTPPRPPRPGPQSIKHCGPGAAARSPRCLRWQSNCVNALRSSLVSISHNNYPILRSNEEGELITSAREAVANAYQTVARSFQRGDADTIAELYTDDAELFVPGVPVISGQDAIREAWKGIVGAGGNTVRVDVREVQESGELAYDTGHFTAT